MRRVPWGPALPMNSSQVIKAWGKILTGGYPSLSIEITRECPLRCPGCYAYEPEHLNGTPLRQLPDKKGEDLVKGVLELVDEYKPLHISIVGGEPLVRFRELNSLLPILNAVPGLARASEIHRAQWHRPVPTVLEDGPP